MSHSQSIHGEAVFVEVAGCGVMSDLIATPVKKSW